MPNTPGQGRTQADKERSKQMSRPVSANPPRRTNGAGAQAPTGPRRNDTKGTARPATRGQQRRPSPRPSQKRAARRSPTALLTWGTAALVIVVVVVLVIVKVTGGSGLSSGEAWSPASPAITAQLASVPESVFNTVGTTSTVAPVTPPIVISGQKALTFTSATGMSMPGVFFYGAEYCPHCAAERWALVVALDRFGTFKNLGDMTSSATDQPPSIPTFTFSKAKYTSPYFVFRPLEGYSNQVNSAGTAYATLQTPTPAEQKLITTYDSSKYLSGLQSGYAAFPFVDIGNKILSEESFPASFLQGFTRDQIAAGLKDPKNPITQAIVASANYLSASICSVDGQQPASVCTSKAVSSAAKALKLS
jgi:hypothetical protein